jgi:hypothetical protein
MKAVLPVEEENFNITSNTFCGLDCCLITPKIDAKWNTNNLFYRSLIVDKESQILSSGFPKFFNYGEKPDCYPSFEKFNDWRYEEKIDGSLLIADYVNETFSMRTRGTVSYITQKNAKDFEYLPDKYPKVIEFLKQNQHLSLLFEIVTPNNIIVVRSQQIEFYFIGAINKNSMVVVTPQDLTDIWRKIGPIPFPQTYNFLDTNNLTKIADTIKHWKGKEGIVVSYNNGQNRVKLKSDWYNWIHRIKSQLNSENNLIEYYIDAGMPTYEDFYEKIETEFDYELAQMLDTQIKAVSEAGNKAKQVIASIESFIDSIRNFETRKQQADHIKTVYSNTKRVPLAFNVLDKKQITDNQKKLLIHQNMHANEVLK